MLIYEHVDNHEYDDNIDDGHDDCHDNNRESYGQNNDYICNK